MSLKCSLICLAVIWFKAGLAAPDPDPWTSNVYYVTGPYWGYVVAYGQQPYNIYPWPYGRTPFQPLPLYSGSHHQAPYIQSAGSHPKQAQKVQLRPIFPVFPSEDLKGNTDSSDDVTFLRPDQLPALPVNSQQQQGSNIVAYGLRSLPLKQVPVHAVNWPNSISRQ